MKTTDERMKLLKTFLQDTLGEDKSRNKRYKLKIFETEE